MKTWKVHFYHEKVMGLVRPTFQYKMRSVCGDIANNSHILSTNIEDGGFVNQATEFWVCTDIKVGSHQWEIHIF